MIKMIIVFIIVDAILSLIYIKVPFHSQRYLVFRPDAIKKWEQKSYIRRYCECFFAVLAVFLICISVNYYNEVNNPSSFEQMLIDGEIEYTFSSNEKDVGDGDIAFEIKQGQSSDQICKIIADICGVLQRGSDNLDVHMEDGEYIIMDGNVQIGRVTTFDSKFGEWLRFYWN